MRRCTGRESYLGDSFRVTMQNGRQEEEDCIFAQGKIDLRRPKPQRKGAKKEDRFG
jgi:hypothetical protein